MILTIEGIDSAGKTTQVEMLVKFLEEQGYSVYSFHFPNKQGTFGKEIYRHFHGETTYSKECLELLHTLDKMMMQEDLNNWKEHYDIVILDRYILTQLVYATASGIPREWVASLTSQMTVPDMGIVLDLPAKTARERRRNHDVYEKDLTFQETVRDNYRKEGRYFGYEIIDAIKSPKEIHLEIKKILVTGGGLFVH